MIHPVNTSPLVKSKIDSERRIKLETRNILTKIVFYVINPLFLLLDGATPYTAVYKQQSPFLHYLFWHFSVFHLVISHSFFYPNIVKNLPWCLTSFYHAFTVGAVVCTLENFMPFIQQLWMMQIGFIGALLSSWLLLFAYITMDLEGFYVISRCAYHVSTFCLLNSFVLTTSYASNVYIDLPSENRKKSKMIFGILHLILGGIIGYLSTRITFNITICLLLVFLSYMFSIYLYNYLTVNSYLLCEHRWYKWEFQESRGIICHVIRRRRHLSNPSEILNSSSSQKGYFQYEDDIQLDQKYYNEYYRLR
ncbi:hypothetical protein GCK72_003505 [Caenorhabditis remanei]|uniref:Uncharacterized protein n=1 Tax=Caenorhabditis remanei TaxID=31234 RepID=A0A6A5HUN0_CAERE|nr:hypothetical protein GCK72_003505 [Caenorhabditis remanei]KAF1771678.1 hypothetical protein GCK72_003505 [Caenorhabditis remanei]